MKKKLFSLLLAAVLLISSSVPAFAASTDAATLRHSVVRIVCGLENNGTLVDGSMGTGFFVGIKGENPQYLVTNHHVISDYLDYNSGQKIVATTNSGDQLLLNAIIRVYYNESDYEEAYVVEADEVNDFAVLRLAAPTDKRSGLPISIPNEEMVGSTAYSVGFPGAADSLIFEATEKWDETGATVNSGSVSRLLTGAGTGTPRIQTTAIFHPGNSGGPLVFENGAAIGITSNHYNDDNTNATIFYAISMSIVKPVLDRNGIAYDLLVYPEAAPEPPAPFPTWAIAAIAAGVVVIVSVLVLVLKKGWKRTGSGKAQMSPTAAPAAKPATPKQAPSGDSGFRVQGVAGAMEGKRTLIPASGSLVIGRNSQSCGVVLPADTAGVSGRHCALWVDKGEVWLKDLGSTHGTFVAPGRRLAAEQPLRLREGDVFWLGSEAQSFAVARKR